MPGIDHTTYILYPIFKRIVGKDKLLEVSGSRWIPLWEIPCGE